MTVMQVAKAAGEEGGEAEKAKRGGLLVHLARAVAAPPPAAGAWEAGSVWALSASGAGRRGVAIVISHGLSVNLTAHIVIEIEQKRGACAAPHDNVATMCQVREARVLPGLDTNWRVSD